MSVSEAQSLLGFVSSLMPAWDAARLTSRGPRHHLRHPSEVEAVFWSAHQCGASVAAASGFAGVGRSTGYRWLQARFTELRLDRVSVVAAARVLRLDVDRAATWEAERRRERASTERSARAAHRSVLVGSLQHATVMAQPRRSRATQDRHARYWRLIGQGHSNADACAIMSIHPKTGRRIRRRGAPSARLEQPSGRYLLLVERLQIADLLGHGLSLRAIAAELGRSVSTVSRELARHRDEQGRYQPYQAEHAATQQRRRPRAPKLLANDGLRELVQRKLNLYWSPQQISGWLRVQHPHEPARVVCHETIYRALIVPGGRCLHSRYTTKLRTGRRLRRSHYDTRSHKDGAVRNMVMISDRPVEVHDRVQPGNWEGDLIIGLGSRSAMVTLRERVTHFGIIVNLPDDHTALTVNAAVQQAFAGLPPHLMRTLTWDQGSEMARHRELAAATGLRIYFAERSSPWQRGANENFNGLARQFFPKNTDLSLHSHEHINTVMKLLNERPRKSLDCQTPARRFRVAANAF